MRTFLLVVFTVSFFNIGSAQQKVASRTIGWAGIGVELHSISDKTKKQTSTIMLNHDSLKIFVLDSSSGWKEPFNLPRRENEKLYGGFFRNNSLYLFLDNGQEPGLHNWVLHLESGEIEQHIVPFDTKERVIDRISCGDHFLFFTINKKTSEFVLYDFTSESAYNTIKHQFDSNMWKMLTASSGLFRSIDVEKVDVEGECSVDVAATKSKIYLTNDTLHLLINRLKGISRIISFSLKNQTVQQRSISHNVSVTNNRGLDIFLKDNAFILKDKLYYVNVTSDSLALQVLDLHSGQLLKKFFVRRDEEISFKNTPILQEKTGFLMNSERELDHTRQLLRKMTNGDAPIVMATMNEKQQVELAIGSYLVQRNTTYSGGFGNTTRVMPVINLTPSGGFYRNTYYTTARFEMLIDPKTNEHIPGIMEPSINDKIELYTKDIKIPTNAENLFVHNGKYYYTYYDRRERTLSMIAF